MEYQRHGATDDGHGETGGHGDAPAEERPRDLVLGGFGLLNVFVLGAAAWVRRRDRSVLAHKAAAKATRSETPKDESR